MTPAERPHLALDVALQVGRALDSMGVGYFLGGSLASSLQGEPRATNDIDFVVDLDEGSVAAFAAALGTDFDVDEEALREAVRRRASWTQWRDVVQVLRVSAEELSPEYLREWAKRLGLTDLLERASNDVSG